MKLFTRVPVVCFEVDETSVYIFCMLLIFLKNLLESENVVCSAMSKAVVLNLG